MHSFLAYLHAYVGSYILTQSLTYKGKLAGVAKGTGERIDEYLRHGKLADLEEFKANKHGIEVKSVDIMSVKELKAYLQSRYVVCIYRLGLDLCSQVHNLGFWVKRS